MNIAMLGHKRIPSREGGIEIVVEELATRMVKRGHNVTCYNRRGHHVSGKKFDTKKAKDFKGIKLVNVLTINWKGLAAITSSFFASIECASKNYDIIHYHAEGPAFMCWIQKLMGKKVVVTIHGLDHKRAKWGKLASSYIMMGEKIAVKFADEIIVLSQETQKYFKNLYGRDTKFIPNGVDRPIIRIANEIKKIGLEKNSFILFLGRVVPEKGIRYLIEAFKQVKTDKKLVIAGGPSDSRLYFEKMKKISETDDRIVYTGFVEGQILDELYSNAYIYCLPSDVEGMPLSLLEAMSFGNCCVVSDIPEFVEVIEDKGIAFCRGDVDQLKRILQELCDDQTLVEKYKEEAADYICKKYSWEAVVESTLALYINLGI